MKFLFFHKAHCAPCTFAKPAVRAVAQSLGVVIHDIDCGPGRAVDVDELLTEHSIRSVPAVIVIDETGTIRAKLHGAGINVAALEAAVAPMGADDQ